jgi:hypothetical protein
MSLFDREFPDLTQAAIDLHLTIDIDTSPFKVFFTHDQKAVLT